MRDLDDVFADSIRRREQALHGAAPAALGAHVRRAVRLRRARRATFQGVAVLAAGALLGTAGWWTSSRQAPTPAVTPTPVTSPSQTSTPTPGLSATPTPTAAVTTAAPTVDPTVDPTIATVPGLPPMPRATPALIASTTPGWVLLDYEPVPSGAEPPTRALLLISPAGVRYHVLDLAPDPDGEFLLDGWTAGSVVADTMEYTQAATTWARLDLLTGHVTRIPIDESLGSFLGWSWDGRRLFDDAAIVGIGATSTRHTLTAVGVDGARAKLAENVYGTFPTIDPTGRHVLYGDPSVSVYTIVDIDGGKVRFGLFGVNHKCAAIGWFDDTAFAGYCWDESGNDISEPPTADEHPALYRFDSSWAVEGAVSYTPGVSAPVVLATPEAGEPLPVSYVAGGGGGFWAAALALDPGPNRSYTFAGYWWWPQSGGDPQKLAIPHGDEWAGRLDARAGAVYMSTSPEASEGNTRLRLTTVRDGRSVQLLPAENDDPVVTLDRGWVVGR